MEVMPTAFTGAEADRASNARRLLAAAAVLAVVLGACTDAGPSEARDPTPSADPGITGTVLVSQRFGGELATIELPDGEPQPLTMPEDVRFVHAAYPLEDGQVLAVVEHGHARLRAYLLTAGTVEPVGPLLRRVHAFSFAAGHLLATRCDRSTSAWLLDLADPERWIPASGACGATLSPDGAEVAWSDGRRVLGAPTVPAADPEPLFDAAELEGLPSGMRRLEVVGGLSWGPGGLAIPLGNSERQGAAVLEPDGAVGFTPLGDRGAGIGASLAWQPSGELLAVASWGTLEAIVRVFPPRGDSRVVAMDADPIAGLVWSPGGDVLLAASQARWTFVTPAGAWIRSNPVPRGELVPIAWMG